MTLHPLILHKNYIFFRLTINCLNLLAPAINYICFNGRYGLEINIKKSYLLSVISVLKRHFYYSFHTVADIVAVDYPSMQLRFRVVYLLLSYSNSLRIQLSVNTRDRVSLDSITNFYPGCGWLEREVWDFFGIYFQGNRDLRRILTDYGFSGYPLRKDFPLTGFYEVLFDDKKHQVVYQPVSLAQEYRDFTHQNPWRLK